MTDDPFDLNREDRYTRLQYEGGDLVSVEDNGDGTAFVTVYASNRGDAWSVWTGSVDLVKNP